MDRRAIALAFLIPVVVSVGETGRTTVGVSFAVGDGAHRVRIHVVGADGRHRSGSARDRLFSDALGPGTHVVVREVPGGVEDVVVAPPGAAREIRYRLELPMDASLRSVPGTGVVEILDPGGAPRVRMSPASALAPGGIEPFALSIGVEGCSFDVSPAPPWGRARSLPGARACDVIVHVPDRASELLVDPLWTTTGDMAVDRTAFLLAPLSGGRALAAGTAQVTPGDMTEIWDGATGTWATVAPMHHGRYFFAGLTLSDGRAIAIGGQGDVTLASTELFDAATGVWTESGNLALARRSLVASEISPGLVLATGGDAGAVPTAKAEVFDVATGAWTGASDMVVPRSDHASVVLADGRVLIAGGRKTTTAISRTAETFDPISRTFSSVAEMRLPRQRFSLVRLPGGMVLAVGGVDPMAGEEDRRATELFDPATGVWKDGPLMTIDRMAPVVALLPGSRVLVAGGFAALGPTETVDILLPLAMETVVADPMSVARANHAAAAISPDGLLVAGGSTSKRSADVFRLLPQGAPCTGDAPCASGLCRDGACCDGSCSEGCQACRASMTGKADGVCAPVSKGSDPHAACSSSSSTCDGAGACVAPPSAACADDGVTSVGADGARQTCAPYRCGGAGVCLAGCDTASDCAPGARCSAGGACAPIDSLRAADATLGCATQGRAASTERPVMAILIALFLLGRRVRTLRA